MSLKVGDQIPDVTVTVMGQNGPAPVKTKDYFSGRKVALFSVPGAFTPTCHKRHLPSFLGKADALRAKGVDAIVVTAVNDVYTLDAWLEATGAKGKIDALADGSAVFIKALGEELDLSGHGLGVRGKRFSALIDNGVVKSLDVEENASACTVSSGEHMLEKL